MNQATVRVPTPLRPLTGGHAEVQVAGATVGQALGDLNRQHAGVLESILDDAGAVRGFVNIYVGESNIRSLQGLDTELVDAAVISIVPAVAGGRR